MAHLRKSFSGEEAEEDAPGAVASDGSNVPSLTDLANAEPPSRAGPRASVGATCDEKTLRELLEARALQSQKAPSATKTRPSGRVMEVSRLHAAKAPSPMAERQLWR